MRYSIILLILIIGIMMVCALPSQSQVIFGQVLDNSSGKPLGGVNISVQGSVEGTVSNKKGEFSLQPKHKFPLTLIFSMVGYKTQKMVASATMNNLKVRLSEGIIYGDEVIVSASRVEESILQSPVTVEKLDLLSIRTSAAANFYDALAQVRGIDMNTHSLIFKFPNARGFNGNANLRMNQLIDGIDNAPPGLSFAAGNIFGLSPLDIESVELLIGASSALYGPGGMNGTILMKSKSPFDYPGISASVQTGIMNLGSSDANPSPMVDANVRWAQTFKNKYAFKFNIGYLRALDWHASDNRNRANLNDTNLNPYFNAGYDGVNFYGDDIVVPVNLKDFSQDIADGVATSQGLVPGTAAYTNEVDRVKSLVPDQLVTRTGYPEKDIVDYNTFNLRSNMSLHYRINSQLELEWQGRFTSGSSVYTAQNRFALKNFKAFNTKVELSSPTYFFRIWGVKEDAGDTYNAGSAALILNEKWKPSSDWYNDFVSSFVASAIFPGGTPLDISSFVSRIFADNRDDRGNILDINKPSRPLPGTPEFDNLFNSIISTPINKGGALTIDHSAMVHMEGMYDFSNLLQNWSLQLGASHRIYSINTSGSIFFDKPGEPIIQHQFGAYGQLGREMLANHLKITLSGRFDKNDRFDSRLTPRFSFVYSLDKNKTHNFRGSAQTAFRFPTIADQWVDLSLGQFDINGKTFDFRVIGGNPTVHEKYGLNTGQVFTLSGNNPFTGQPNSEPFQIPEFRPETVTAFELGYKGFYFNKAVLVDSYVFRNNYNGFHAQQALVQNPGSNNEKRYITTISTVDPVITYGWSFGANLHLVHHYLISGDLTNNSINENSNTTGFQSRFNTPKYKINLSVANRKLTDRLGFRLTWHWQDSFFWQSDFGTANMDAYNTLDAQVSVKMERFSSSLKIGGSNILNQYYTTGFGNAQIGGLYYVTLTFDELMN